MKILFFIHGLCGGGAERIASILLNHFCEKHDTHVAITNFRTPFYPINNRVHIIDDRIKSKIKGASRIPRFIKMAHTIRKINPDIIISFLVIDNNRTLTANLFCRRKLIVSERNSLNRALPKKEKIIRKILYPTADKIVFVTSEDCTNFGCPKKSIYIHNPAMFEPYVNYNNRKKTIATISTDNKWYQKGLDILIQAWNKIAPHNPDWNFEIYGKLYGAPLPDIITQQKQERISWKGWQDDIDKELREKSIFVLASRFEGCPNSLIEAMSQGCACLGTDGAGGIKEIITNGVDGLIAKNENVDDIAKKIQMMIDDEPLRRRLSAGAIEKVKQFDKDIFFAKWDKLIEEVAGK